MVNLHRGTVERTLMATLLEQQFLRPRTHQTIRKESISRAEDVPHSAQQAQLALPLASVAGDAQV
jgi:hypothetical protein